MGRISIFLRPRYLDRYQFAMAFWSLGKHTFSLGASFNTTKRTARSTLRYRLVVLTSDFGFADLNGDEPSTISTFRLPLLFTAPHQSSLFRFQSL